MKQFNKLKQLAITASAVVAFIMVQALYQLIRLVLMYRATKTVQHNTSAHLNKLVTNSQLLKSAEEEAVRVAIT
nr:hypothetical protein [Leuconostoc lactis]